MRSVDGWNGRRLLASVDAAYGRDVDVCMPFSQLQSFWWQIKWGKTDLSERRVFSLSSLLSSGQILA